MESIQKYKLFGLIYGFCVGFVIVLFYLTFENTPETLSIFAVLKNSALCGLVTGVIYWFYIMIIKVDIAAGNGGSGCDDSEHGGYDSGGSSGGSSDSGGGGGGGD